jgi:hypothetical protein
MHATDWPSTLLNTAADFITPGGRLYFSLGCREYHDGVKVVQGMAVR